MARIGDQARGPLSSDRWQTLRGAIHWLTRSYIVMIVLGIIVGLQVAPVVVDIGADPVQGTVAVVPLAGGIGGGNAASVAARLKQARNDPSIDAVVLRVNSGGGGAASSEEIYLEVAKTAEQMPVVTSVGSISGSGAYYGSVSSDYMFVKPASLVGNIGVVFTLPTDIDPIDGIIATGPNKLTGADRRGWYYKTESIKRAFVSAVMEQRGDALELSRNEVQSGELWTGAEAVENGIADEIGGLDAAITKAAEMADLQRWNSRVLSYDDTVAFLTQSAYLSANVEDKELVSPATFVVPPQDAAAPNILMVPRSIVRAGLEDAAEAGRTGTAIIPDTEPGEVTANATRAA